MGCAGVNSCMHVQLSNGLVRTFNLYILINLVSLRAINALITSAMHVRWSWLTKTASNVNTAPSSLWSINQCNDDAAITSMDQE